MRISKNHSNYTHLRLEETESSRNINEFEVCLRKSKKVIIIKVIVNIYRILSKTFEMFFAASHTFRSCSRYTDFIGVSSKNTHFLQVVIPQSNFLIIFQCGLFKLGNHQYSLELHY